MAEILFRDEAYAIIGACFEVYNELGNGFQEAVYQEALEMELRLRDVPTQPHPELTLYYKGRPLKKAYVPDFTCYGKIVVEIKAVLTLDDTNRSQLHNYLKATAYRLGLLVNFGSPGRLQYERVVH
jgi:GxxExxY protein